MLVVFEDTMVDRHATPRVIVSVLMLREGFDVNNICVIVPLRSSQAQILLEQTKGARLGDLLEFARAILHRWPSVILAHVLRRRTLSATNPKPASSSR